MSLLIKNYNFLEITNEVINNCIRDVDFIYENKEFIKLNCPQQTHDILFDERNPKYSKNWQILKNTFLQSVENYSGKKFNNCKAWVFACFPQTKTIQYDWHIHPNAIFTGIMYLSLPNGSNTTEFMNEDKTTFFLPHKIAEWFIFRKEYVHRNGYWDFEKMNDKRYCLAASII